jgi:hypothetical protein
VSRETAQRAKQMALNRIFASFAASRDTFRIPISALKFNWKGARRGKTAKRQLVTVRFVASSGSSSISMSRE